MSVLISIKCVRKKIPGHAMEIMAIDRSATFQAMNTTLHFLFHKNGLEMKFSCSLTPQPWWIPGGGGGGEEVCQDRRYTDGGKLELISSELELVEIFPEFLQPGFSRLRSHCISNDWMFALSRTFSY